MNVKKVIMTLMFRVSIIVAIILMSLMTFYPDISQVQANGGGGGGGGGGGISAVAPDDSDIIALLDFTTNEVAVSTDGGNIYTSLGTPQSVGGEVATTTYDIAISPMLGGIHYIAVAGQQTGDRANIWYYDLGNPAPEWRETRNLSGFQATSAYSAAYSIEFSPAFTSDWNMTAITATWDNAGSIDCIYFEIFSFNLLSWNFSAGWDNYPVIIACDDGITGLDSASIVLDEGYSGGDELTRKAIVELIVLGDADAQALSGRYQLDDFIVTKLPTSAVPTMTEWGIIFLAVVLGLLLTYVVRKKQMA